jgi:hypothetical protein
MSDKESIITMLVANFSRKELEQQIIKRGGTITQELEIRELAEIVLIAKQLNVRQVGNKISIPIRKPLKMPSGFVKKPDNNQRRGPMSSGAPATLEQREKTRRRVFSIRAEMNKKKDKVILDKMNAVKEQQRVEAEAREKFKGCWRSSSGNMICPGKKRGIFVSPKQFGKNVSTALLDTIPKAAMAVGALGFIAPELVPAGLVFGVGLASKGVSSGKALGNIANFASNPKARQTRMEDINVGDKCWRTSDGRMFCKSN